MAHSTTSLVTGANLVSKVYVPRLIIPASSAIAALIDFLIALWRSLALVRQIARTYGGRPGAAGLWRLWRGVLRNVVYAPVGEVEADTLSQVLGGGVAARISGQAAQGLGTGLLIGRLGLEAIRACRPLPFTGREATQPSLKVLGEGMLQLLKGSLTKPGPS